MHRTLALTISLGLVVLAACGGGGSGTDGPDDTSPTRFTLTLSPGANGTITASPAGPTYASGTEVTLTAVPENGFDLESWSGTDNDSLTSLTNTVTITDDTTVSATFETEGTTYTLTLISSPDRGAGPTWGSIHADPPGEDYVATQDVETIEYAPNTVVTLTAHEDVSTWPFTHWTITPGGAMPTTCSIDITMDQDKTVQADFPLVGGGANCP